jgi:hypothetical protein
MSSAISTKPKHSEHPEPTAAPDQALQAWQFFVLAALGCATAATFMARGQGVVAVVLLSVLMGTAAVAGIAMLRTIRPLVSPDDDRTAMIGQRTRAALEREKLLALRAIKELEFDRAMGKLSEDDFRDMAGRLRTRAARIIRQLDAGAGYRGQIEREVAARLTPSRARVAADVEGHSRTERACVACQAVNDHDARFCKNCGRPLA